MNGPRWISSRETSRCGDPSMLRLVPELLERFPGSSAGEVSACSAGDPGSIPGLGRHAGERDRLPTPVFLGFPGGSAGEESTCSGGDLGSIPLQYSVLESCMDCVVHGIARVGHN